MDPSRDHEKPTMDAVEKSGHGGDSGDSDIASDVQVDKNGLPLVPQPSKFRDDPLVSKTSPFKRPHRLRRLLEHATLAQMGRPDTSVLRRFLRAFQLCSGKSVLGGAWNSFR